MQTKVLKSSGWISALFGIAAVSVVVLMISFPGEAFSASLSGLRIWWEYVFPALLPFFILSEIMLGLGVVHALGVLLEPLMRLLFRLPGASAWPVAISFTSGYPSGAKAAADLRKQGVISSEEGSKLAAIAHLCSPVFLTSVVAASFWGHPEFGFPLIAIHLISALLTGLLISRFVFPAPKVPRGGKEETPIPVEPADVEPPIQRRKKPPLFLRMADSMLKGQRQDGRAFGRLLGDAVSSSVQSLLLIGGFMIVISVLLKLLSVSGVTSGLQQLIEAVFIPLGIPSELAAGTITAFFEVHLGAYSLISGKDTGVWTAALLCAAIGWGGLSVHAQVKSLLFGTDLRYKPFLIARALHAAVSILVTFALWKPMQTWLFPRYAEGVFVNTPVDANGAAAVTGRSFWPNLADSLVLLAIFLAGSILLSLLVRVFFPKRFLDLRRH